MDTEQRIIHLIKSDNLDQALATLDECFKNHAKHSDIILLISRNNENERKTYLNLSSDEFLNIEKNKIRVATLSLLKILTEKVKLEKKDKLKVVDDSIIQTNVVYGNQNLNQIIGNKKVKIKF